MIPFTRKATVYRRWISSFSLKMICAALAFSFLAGSFFSAKATSVTGLNAQYRNGQVFLTWNNISGSVYYKVYRSQLPITSSTQLPASDYLGYVSQTSSLDNALTVHDGVNVYLRIDSLGSRLTSVTGLFVFTSLANGDYYYAVTTLDTSTKIEDQTINTGGNSLLSSIHETTATPKPVFQETRTISNKPVTIYTSFMSLKKSEYGPLMNNTGSLAEDFAFYLNNAVSKAPMHMMFHPGGNDFLTSINKVTANEINLNVEDLFPSAQTSAWLGANKNYDLNNANNNMVPPVADTDYSYTVTRIDQVIAWAIHHLPIDSNRIYLEGTSFGSQGAYLYALLRPQHIAAVKVTVGGFNLSFENDYNPECSMNASGKNRQDGDNRFGTVTSNLMSDMGYHFYDMTNGGWMIHQFPTKDLPMMFSVNGTNDDLLGWTEKPIYYDSVNANHAGGWFFWDPRDHAGNGKTWGNNFDFFRYRSNLSYPAFAYCTANENPGDGNGGDGAPSGSINGYLDWDSSIVDNAANWQLKIWMRDLVKSPNGTQPAPDSCRTDITPRRLQQFHPAPGTTVNWDVRHQGQVIQSGSYVYQGGLIIVPQVKIDKDTVTFHLYFASQLTKYFRDADQDSYGNRQLYTVASSQPAGYVLDSTDCNDANAAVHPGAVDFCNGIDDNCNGSTDENAFSVSINAGGSTTICSSSFVTLSAQPTGASYTYQWLKNNVVISGATQSTYAANATGNYSAAVSNGTCSFTTISIAVTANASPTPSITPNGTVSSCNGVKITLTANSGSKLTYQWYKDGILINNATKKTYTVPANDAGNYTVNESNSGDCSATSDATVVVRIAAPTAKITPQGSTNICSTGSVDLKANSGSGYTYQWQKNAANIGGATNRDYIATTAGSYTVIVSNSAGCPKTSKAVSVTSCKSVEDLSTLSGTELQVFPNPAADHFTITLNDSFTGTATAELFDVLGQQALVTHLDFNNGIADLKIAEGKMISNGLYMINVRFGDEQKMTKVVIEH